MPKEPAQSEIERAALPQNTIVLTIPARAEYITLCRLALAGLGGQGRLSEETLSDLKVAVSEACSHLLRLPALADTQEQRRTLRTEYQLFEDRWIVEVSVDDFVLPPLEEPQDPRSESALGLTIIQALVDEVEVEPPGGEGRVLRLVKFLP